MLKLSDAMRPLSDPIEIQGLASMVLGEQLRANRVFYGEIDEESSEMLVEREFVSEGTPSAVGRYPMEVFAWLRSSPQKFEPTVVQDVQNLGDASRDRPRDTCRSAGGSFHRGTTD